MSLPRSLTHGGNIWRAARETGRPVPEWLDFSASINPLGSPPWVRAAMRRALSQVAHYPDPDLPELRAAVAHRHGLSPEQVWFGNGAAELIHLLVAALAPTAGAVLAPTFARYGAALASHGIQPALIPAWPDPAAPGLLQWLEAAPPDAALFLCQPNNPTGQLIPDAAMHEALAVAERRGVWVVVDEAFLDFVPEAVSLLPLCRQHPRLVVLHSLTKLYAIPGLRIGYLAGPAELIRRLARGQVPWAVNTVAAAAGLAALTGPDYRPATQQAVARERAWLQSRLAALPGLRPQPSAANYFLVQLQGLTGTQLQAGLHRQGILIRTCTGFAGLGDQYVRLAVRPRREARQLVAALAQLLAARNGG